MSYTNIMHYTSEFWIIFFGQTGRFCGALDLLSLFMFLCRFLFSLLTRCGCVGLCTPKLLTYFAAHQTKIERNCFFNFGTRIKIGKIIANCFFWQVVAMIKQMLDNIWWRWLEVSGEQWDRWPFVSFLLFAVVPVECRDRHRAARVSLFVIVRFGRAQVMIVMQQ